MEMKNSIHTIKMESSKEHYGHCKKPKHCSVGKVKNVSQNEEEKQTEMKHGKNEDIEKKTQRKNFRWS